MKTRSISSFSVTNGTAGSDYSRLTNFSPNSIIFNIEKTAVGATALTDSDLANFTVSVQFKNRLGKNAVILNNVPLSMIAKMSDYEGGFSCNTVDTVGGFRLPIGKVVLTGQDEISISVSFGASAPTSAVTIYAVDEAVGKENICIYEYAVGSAGQQLTFPNALIAYMGISSPDNAINVRCTDFFDSDLITELEIVTNGSVLGRAENFDNFGSCWSDKTGFSQNLSITCGSSNESVLVREWFYDAQRIGVAQSEISELSTYASDIKKTNSEKYQCLVYMYGLK